MDKSQFLETMNSINQILELEVEKMADEKIVSLTKSHAKSINKEQVVQQCKKTVFDIFYKKFDEVENVIDSFFNNLKSENLELYNQIKKNIVEKADINKEVLLENNFWDLKLSQDELEKLNAIGLDHFHKKEWSKAHEYFSFLTYFDSENPVHWVLKGMTEHNLEEFENATSSYFFALSLAPNYLFGHLQFIKCLIASKHHDYAKQYLERLLHMFDPKTYHDDLYLKNEIENLKQLILKK